MNIYKFQDQTDGNFAFVLATNLQDAIEFLESKTALKFALVEFRPVEQVKTPLLIFNSILPF